MSSFYLETVSLPQGRDKVCVHMTPLSGIIWVVVAVVRWIQDACTKLKFPN